MTLYDDLVAAADPEGLVYYGRGSRATPPELLALVDWHFLVPYRAGKGHAWHVWLPVLRPPVDGSDLPPPSLQNGAVRCAYYRRDGHCCHLCGRPTALAWDTPKQWPSLDHLTPRVFGGSDYPSNIKTSHRTCNYARRERPVDVARARTIARLAARQPLVH